MIRNLEKDRLINSIIIKYLELESREIILNNEKTLYFINYLKNYIIELHNLDNKFLKQINNNIIEQLEEKRNERNI